MTRGTQSNKNEKIYALPPWKPSHHWILDTQHRCFVYTEKRFSHKSYTSCLVNFCCLSERRMMMRDEDSEAPQAIFVSHVTTTTPWQTSIFTSMNSTGSYRKFTIQGQYRTSVCFSWRFVGVCDFYQCQRAHLLYPTQKWKFGHYLLTHMLVHTYKSFIHLQNTNYVIFVKIWELSEPP